MIKLVPDKDGNSCQSCRENDPAYLYNLKINTPRVNMTQVICLCKQCLWSIVGQVFRL